MSFVIETGMRRFLVAKAKPTSSEATAGSAIGLAAAPATETLPSTSGGTAPLPVLVLLVAQAPQPLPTLLPPLFPAQQWPLGMM